MLKNIGNRVKLARKVKGITQEQLAERTNLSLTCISRLENEKSMVSLEKLLIIADALDVDLSVLLCDYLDNNLLHSVYEKDLVNNFNMLSENDKLNVMGIISVLLKNYNK